MTLPVARPLVMGVVNVTPNSFSDGHIDPITAVAHGLQLVADGADILDVGGEATNPRAAAIDADAELRRVIPVIEALAGAGAVVSIDTTKAKVARAAIRAGATIVNDVSGGLFDPRMVEVLADTEATYIAGHLRGGSLAEVFGREAKPPTWQEVADELVARLAALPAGVRSRTWVDPGLGFGKGAGDANFELIRRVGTLAERTGAPVVVGPSRKRFLRQLAGDDAVARDVASVVACLGAVAKGAHVVRVHNVALLRIALAVYTKVS